MLVSHLSGGDRHSTTYLCEHLAAHGYAVAALDHSEVVVPELRAPHGETAEAAARRIEAVVASRVPDLRLALDRLSEGSRAAVVGHSFGGWTALAAPEVEPRVRAVVSLAPAGSSHPRPGVLPVTLSFAWGRPVPTLVLTGDQDVLTPLDGVAELFRRCPPPKRMFVLRRADHLHFLDDAASAHEALRASSLPGEAAWIPGALRPFAELCTAEAAHTFAGALTLAHLDAVLRDDAAAGDWLARDAVPALARRGVDAYEAPGDDAG
ncbi:alpha/beta hydrolase family protein [Geodermatophilus sp. URMC 64]